MSSQPAQTRVLAVVNHTASRRSSSRSVQNSARLESATTARSKQYCLDQQSYLVHFVDYSLDDVLSGKLSGDDSISAADDLHLDGVMYLYDVMKSDVLLVLPGLLGE